MNSKGSRWKRWGPYLAGALVVAYATFPVMTMGYIGVVVSVLGCSALCLLWLVDEPGRPMPTWVEWMLPLKGRWGRWLVMGMALAAMLSLPLWVEALLH